MCRKLICLIGLVAVFAWSANALAVTTLVDEFDSYANGQINAVTGTPPKWNEIVGTTTLGFIKGAPGNPLNKVFGWTEATGSPGAYGILSGNAIIPVGATKTLFMRIRTTLSSTGTPNTGFGLTSIATPGNNSWGTINTFVRILNGNLQAFDRVAPPNPPGSNYPPTKPVAANTWYNLWIVVDHSLGTGEDTFKVYMNTSGNAQASDLLGFNDPNNGVFHFRTSAINTADLIRFECMSWSTASPPPEILFDDIYVSDGVDLTAKPGKWASCPNPADGSMYDGTNVTLTWTPGRDADKHDVYFGNNFNDVNNASRANHSQPGLLHYSENQPNANYPVTTGLTPGATYYWRIDEVSSGGSPIYKGDVWSFTTQPLTAYNPSPPDGDVLVDPNVNLSWFAGMSAADVNGHKVYFSSDFNDVNERKPAAGPFIRTEPNYIFVPLLTLGETYYWAVDEVNVATWPGPVWSFTIWPDIPITDPNLVGWWKFEDSGGRKTLDSSGHNRHGTLNGSPAYATGIFGQAINLDGTDDWVSVGSVGAGMGGVAPRTIAGWAKMNITTIAAWTNVFGFTGGGNATEHTCFDIGVSGPDTPMPTGQYTIHVLNWQQVILPPDLEWHHLAATYDGNTNNMIRWYCDGYLIGEAAAPTAPGLTTVNNVQMGKHSTNENHFPGLIDDVRIYNKALTEAEIGQIMASTSAYKPYPADGVTGVPRQLTLTWEPGLDANSVKGHELYFSSDFDDVNERTAAKIVRSVPSYGPIGPLNLDQTYYWRVDEVNKAGPDPCFWPGDVWSFTVANYVVVEDFDSYADDDALRAVWKEGSPIATVSLNNTDSNYVRDGNSMQYHYDLYNSPYSEADANTTGLNSLPSGIGSNWTAGGVKALSLWFYGQAGNDANKPMYVKLTDSASKSAKIIYDSDMNDIREQEWHEWNIALQEFVDACSVLNLANVSRITIGFGDGVAAYPVEDMGNVYFEDIRLYIPRCMPGTVPDSASGNCLIDYPDLRILTNNWLISEYDVVPVEPNNNNLIGWWRLDDGSGTIAVDSSINDNDGNLAGDPNSRPQWVAGKVDGALDFNGVTDYVDCSNDVSLNEPNSTGKITLAAWVKTNDCGDSNFNPYITKGDHAYALQHRAPLGTNINELEIAIYDAAGTTWHFASTPVNSSFNGVWHHLAGTYNGSKLKLYIDGELKATTDYVGPIASETANVNLGKSSDFTDRFYDGLLDDVRIYSRALSPDEVAWLADLRDEFTQPLEPLLTPPNLGINLYKDGTIDLRDYAVLASKWLEEVLWPAVP